MKLSLEGLKETALWKEAKIFLPSYDVAKIQAKTSASPKWVHFGIGNIFVFLLAELQMLCFQRE